MEGLAFFRADDDSIVIEDLRYDHTNTDDVLSWTFGKKDGEAVTSYLADLSEIHKHFDDLTDLVDEGDKSKRAEVFKSMADFLKLARAFAGSYGFGVITPFLRSPWNTFEEQLQQNKTVFDDKW